ncbi:S-(hydroxymethyl)glutathione dehydrogenase, partial [Klebsiella pneumoniae]|nr:S-(hydroxymethyl)glutathione dehydrogenase [Klebsiella pneumoniae]
NIRLEPLMTPRLPREPRTEAFELMHDGHSMRTVIHFGDQ